MSKSIKVEDFRTSWADHFNMPKQYYNPHGKPQTVDVLVNMLSRSSAPSSADVAGGHIDSLTNPRDAVRVLDGSEYVMYNVQFILT